MSGAAPGFGTDLQLSISFADEAVVAITGELDLASAPDFEAMLDTLIGRGHVRLTIDCSELSFIDASGVSALVAAHNQLSGTAGGIRVEGVSALAHRIFEITGLLEMLHVKGPSLRSRREDNDAPETDGLALHAARLAAESAHADALEATLSAMTALIPEMITPCDGASITLRRRDHFITAAASNDTALDLDLIQYAAQQGPCVDASNDGLRTRTAALAHEQRWPSFTTQARERGMESILSTPLVVNDEPIGALNLYSRIPSAFLALDHDLASVLAAQIAMLLHQPDLTTEREFDDRIHDALSSRDIIAQAQGILMERLTIDAREAFATLRRDSVRTSTPLRTRAGDIVTQTQQAAAVPDSDGPADE